jgi:D-alanyl-D-alanine carboxypeptidase
MRAFTSRVAAVFGCALVCLSCQPHSGKSDIRRQLQSLLDAAVRSSEAVPGAALHVDAPPLGLSWESAAGVADPESGRPMTAGTPVRIASNTKTFVAAAVLRLNEEELLDLDDSIADFLPEEYVKMLEGDGYDPRAMTVRHLLNHTSGLFDHTSGDRYTEAILADPMHRWTRAEQLRCAVDWGDPLGEPGEYFSYCDTGYVLLGAIIEEVSGLPLPEAVRRLLNFEDLGLVATWWEGLEPQPRWVPDRAHQFYGEVDTFGFDPSFDLYGGGGLVSTVGDLARFYRALLTGDVFDNFFTGSLMLTPSRDARELPNASGRTLPPDAYGMGIWEQEVEGFVTYRHSGFFGTLATYVPDLDLVITATTNQHLDGGAQDDLARAVIRLVADSSPW